MNTDLVAIQKTVKEKLGRNVLLFQYLEKQLKILTPYFQGSGVELTQESAEKIKNTRKNKNTLGMLFGKFTRAMSPATDESESDNATHITIKSSFSMDENAKNEFVRTLKDFADSRNEVVHFFIERWDINSMEEMVEAEKFLDQQQERVISQIKNFTSISEALKESLMVFPDLYEKMSLVKRFVDISGMSIEYESP